MISLKAFVKNIFGSDAVPTQYVVKAKHRETANIVTWTFDSKDELDEYMFEYCPMAHLNYIRTQVFEVVNGNLKLIEQHEHLTGNVKYETNRFNEQAEKLGLSHPRVRTYSNVSSAVTSVAYFS